MIVGIGIDTVSVKRFASWSNISITQLKKVFSEEEIAYCLKVPTLSAQRFAVRFAVREAFFKALCAMQKSAKHPFLMVCKTVHTIHSDHQIPELRVNWKMLGIDQTEANSLHIHCSLTHTHEQAGAVIVIEQC